MKKMSKEKAKRWLRAVCSLRAYYRGDNHDYKDDCPLCWIADDCDTDCIWMLFNKMTCGEYGSRHGIYGVATARLFRDPRWTALAIPRLDGWGSKLLAIIGEKK